MLRTCHLFSPRRSNCVLSAVLGSKGKSSPPLAPPKGEKSDAELRLPLQLVGLPSAKEEGDFVSVLVFFNKGKTITAAIRTSSSRTAVLRSEWSIFFLMKKEELLIQVSGVKPASLAGRLPFFLRSYGAQAFLLPENGETERGVKTIDRARSPSLSTSIFTSLFYFHFYFFFLLPFLLPKVKLLITN